MQSRERAKEVVGKYDRHCFSWHATVHQAEKLEELIGEAIDEAVVEERNAEMERCCRNVCVWCRRQRPVRRDVQGNWWHQEPHLPSARCDAARIRERAQQSKDGE